MGSIAAVLPRTGTADPAVIRRMLQAAPHRGTRMETVTTGRCLLAVSNPDDVVDARLARRGALVAAFTGTLDNQSELVRELEAPGATVGASPAEIVLSAFEAFGDDMPNRLRGAFAALITDGRRVFALRDQIGFGTLFYRQDHQGFFAATEAKQVVAGAGIPREPDVDVLARIFYGELDDDTPTALKGAERLPKATILTLDGVIRRRRYWEPEALLETGRYSDTDLHERFEDLMAQAVTRTISGNDVVSLSGGIDSPPIAAYGAEEHLRLSGRPLAALSAVYPDQPTVDESGYIKIVADAINIPLYTYERTAKPLDRLEEWCRVLDGPVPRILHSDAEEHYQHVRRLGFRTMLTGEVAEFVFAMRGFTVAHLLLHGRLPALYRYCRGQGSASRAALARQLLVAPVPRPAAALYERCNSKWGLRAPSWIDRPRIRRAAAADVVTARERWRHQQLTGFIGPGLSMEADDVLQSLFGVRTRRPWADVDLWEFFLSLPAEVKYTGARRKGLVRELLRGRVPDEILDRRDKTGFDESLMARVDYPALRRLLVNPTFRLPGVDYTLLGERLQREDFTVPDYNWAKDLAGIHAFVGLW